MMTKRTLAALAIILAAVPALGQQFGPGSYAAFTVGTGDGIIVAATNPGSKFLDIVNQSPTATVCINFGAAATITGTACAAGEYTLPPLWHRSWENSFVPSDVIHAIASAASTPVTVGVK